MTTTGIEGRENAETAAEPSVPAWRRLAGLSMRFGRALVDVVHPPACVACNAAVAVPHALCGACWRAMPFVERPFCERFGTPLPVQYGATMLSPTAIAEPPSFDRARAVARYDGPARELVHRLKYGDGLHLVPPMAGWMARAGAELLAEADLIVPVPMHRFRLWRRRFNQAASLARLVGEIAGKPIDAAVLRRIRATSPQPGLTRSERAANLQRAFAIRAEAVESLAGKRVLLVDDVLTTGATGNACAQALRKVGVKHVDLLVFACVAADD